MDWLRALLATQGAPYVWGGHGMELWAANGMVPHAFGGVDVFDCSGLVTTTLWRIGSVDWRRSHNAQYLYEACAPTPDRQPLALRFYGPSVLDVRHVAVNIAAWGKSDVLKIEAAGGGRETTAPRSPLGNARVMVRLENRADFLCARSLPADVLERP